MSETNKVLTFGEIKDFVNKMDEEQLKQEAFIWVSDNEMATEIHAIEELGEDKYYFVDHEYACGKSDFDKDMMMSDEFDEPLYETIEDAIKNEEHIITPANRVYFHAFD